MGPQVRSVNAVSAAKRPWMWKGNGGRTRKAALERARRVPPSPSVCLGAPQCLEGKEGRAFLVHCVFLNNLQVVSGGPPPQHPSFQEVGVTTQKVWVCVPPQAQPPAGALHPAPLRGTPKGEEKPTEASLSPPLGNHGWNTRWGAQREAEGQERSQRLLDLGLGGWLTPTHSSPSPERRNRNLETGYPSCWQKAGGKRKVSQ